MENLLLTNIIRSHIQPTFTAAKEQLYSRYRIKEQVNQTFRLESKTLGTLFPTAALQRDLTGTGATSGQELLDTSKRPDLGEVLPQDTVNESGITFQFGLVGNTYIPEVKAVASLETVDGAGVAKSTPTTGEKVMTPKSVMLMVDLSRPLAESFTPAFEKLLMKEFSNALYQKAMDLTFHGDGENGEPLGLQYHPDVIDYDGTDLTDANAKEIVKQSNNVIAHKNKKFITNPDIAYLLNTRPKEAGAAPHILDEENRIARHQLLETNSVNGNYLFFGHFPSVLVGIWGEDMNVFMIKSARTGKHTLIAELFMDVMIRNAGQFVRSEIS